MKVFSGLQFERVLITLLYKFECGHITWFQLEKYGIVYWTNVRELPKHTLSS